MTSEQAVRQAPEPLTLGDLATMLRRRRGAALASAALAAGAVLVVALMAPASYRAEAALTLDRSEPPVEFTASKPQPEDLLNTQRELIVSRAVIEEAYRLGGLSANGVYARATDPLAVLAKRLRAVVAKNASVIEVSLTDEDPHRAERTLQAVIDAYQAGRARDSRARREADVRALADQTARAEERLDAAKGAVRRFRDEHAIAGTDPERNHISERLGSLAVRQAEVDAKVAANEALLEQVRAADQLPVGDERRSAYLRIDQISTLTVTGQLLTQLDALRGEEAVLAQKYGDKHPRLIEARRHIELKRELLDAAIAQARAGIESEHAALVAERRNLVDTLGGLRTELNRYRADLATLAGLMQEEKERAKLREDLATRLAQQQVLAFFEGRPLVLVDAPVASPAPDGLGLGPFVGIALVVGAAAGLLAAVAADALDRRLRDAEAARRLTGLPVLAAVPAVGALPALAHSGPAAPVAVVEAFRTLRVALRLPSGAPQVIAVLSADGGDGRTTAAARLASGLASAGFRTLLVDGDLRRPGVDAELAVAGGGNLAQLLAGEPDIAPAASGHANLDVLPAGAEVANAGELLASHCLPEWIAHIRGFYDAIVIDTPPLAAAADALQVLEVADTAVLVLRFGNTHVDHLVRAMHQVEARRQRIAGILLVGFPGAASS